MRILGIIILYNPHINDVLINISKFINEIDHLIVWQNSECNGIEIILSKYGNKITLMGDEKNQGIAYALNSVANLVKKDSKFSHLLAMDQDSNWNDFEKFVNIVHKRNDSSIYSPNINREDSISSENLKKVDSCITSGTLFSKESLFKIVEFNEVYSVDCVDYDFSFKAIRKGIDIYKVCNVEMVQTYGSPGKTKFFNIKSNVYSATRSYFIVRNHILLWKDYPNHLNFKFKFNILKHYIFVRIIKIIIMEDNKVNKIISILRGLFDGVVNDRTRKYI